MSATSRTATARLEGVLRRSEDLAGAWGARARASTTLARERAILRLFGVDGLDRNGVALVSSVVERHAGASRDRLAAGVALPFAVALLEYDVDPRQLALDVAGGTIDLAFEAELLSRPERRAAAEAEARRILDRALARVDANRVARRDLIDVLGDAPRPWLCLTVANPMVQGAAEEAAGLVAVGADLLRVRMPAVRELMLGLHGRGREPRHWLPREAGEAAGDDASRVPVGSQRGLAALRETVDESAAEAGRYVRIATAAPALAAPEQALVAALERVDVVEADAVAEIVGEGVDPDRALADHAFGHRLLLRSGATVLVGAGPLAVAPDLASGQPADPATRAGRAFALQALAVALARGDGVPDDRLAAGALVPWLADEREPAAQALAAVALRRLAWPEVTLAFDEPELPGHTVARWPYLAALSLAVAGPRSIVFRMAASPLLAAHAADTTRAAAHLAAELAEPATVTLRRPHVGDRAGAILAAAEATLAGLADRGWSSVLGAPVRGAPERLGADAVVERTEAFDPLGS